MSIRSLAKGSVGSSFTMPSPHHLLLITALPALCVALLWSSSLHHYAQSVISSLSILTPSPIVVLDQGTIVGTILDKEHPPIEAFMGFPYAYSPIGDKRFRRAVPLPASNETVIAKKYGPM